MEWGEFTLALATFLGSHVIPARLRGPLVASLGKRGYIAGYSLLSLALLYWLILAAGRAPFVEIWPQEPWMRWLVNLAMPVAVAMALVGGMAGLMGGFVLWGAAHLLANGDLAHVVLFGLLLAYALFGLAISLRQGVALRLTWPRLALAALAWAALLYLHLPVIGVSPLP
ncbi:NnrU family protein [Paracoccus sp. P2]|uniref:NnrU family protein n=1 Tax=Paracoccus pantotrophus TaxID=82367 RepID=A0A7H9BY04_PARPN|nr:NnrU family protein [Paracoccus pantotrophus]MDF3854649.1 NnrU family protein [Paracoccus pantotrophus]QLH15665.1 NnrU family protein [Paracoccus pantotrophus]RDE00814.1 NnrU family protein [Paracoccus pantotrophus]RNI20184.1 NnrU family protein [Paracoccus pantotrophus]WGR63878.1 NnrU family protein [Paracoccus pantotrophus]